MSTREDYLSIPAGGHGINVAKLLDKIERLESEIRELKTDAERYRYIRGGSGISRRWNEWKIEFWTGENGWEPMQDERMDKAIDTAIAEMKGENKS